MSIVVLVLEGEACPPRCAVQRGIGIIGNQQRAIQNPIQVTQREVCIPLLSAQVDVTLGMQTCRAIALAIVQAQTLQVQITHITIGRKHIVVIADGAMGIGIKVTTLVGTGGIDVGIATTQFAARLDVSVVSAVVAHAGQVDCGIGPSGAAVSKVKSMSACIDAARQVANIIVRQERLDREIVE